MNRSVLNDHPRKINTLHEDKYKQEGYKLLSWDDFQVCFIHDCVFIYNMLVKTRHIQ